MAKENNLYDLLLDIGNQIRIKEGSQEEINPQDFGLRIRELPIRKDGYDLTQIGYQKEISDKFNLKYMDGLQYAIKIQNEWVDENNISNKYKDNNQIVFFPQVSFVNLQNASKTFNLCPNLEIFPNLENNGTIKTLISMFENSRQLRIVGNLYKFNNGYSIFRFCTALEEIGIMDCEDTIQFNATFSTCPKLRNLKFYHWKKADNSFGSSPLLSIQSINYLIENALGVAEGAEQRTLTLHAEAKTRWQDPNQNPQYEYYAAMAAEKLITIA